MSTIQPKCVSYFCSYPDVVQKMYSERLPVSCSSTCHDFIYFGNHEMVKNAKTWLSWEQKIIFLKNQNILNLCLFLHFWEHFFSRTPSSSQNIYIYMYCCGNAFSSSRQRCLFILGWSPFQWWNHNENILCGRCFVTLTRLTAHLFLEGWLKLNLNCKTSWDWLREISAGGSCH